MRSFTAGLIAAVALIAALVMCGATLAKERPSDTAAASLPETARAPYAALRKLDGMLGVWRVTSEIMSPEGEWTQTSVTRLEYAKTMRGLQLTETHLATLEGASMEMEVNYTFDQYQNVYRAFVMDDTFGLGDVYEGDIDGDNIVLTNLRADTHALLPDGRRMHFRLTVPIKGDVRDMRVDQSVDAGATWSPFFRVVFERA